MIAIIAVDHRHAQHWVYQCHIHEDDWCYILTSEQFRGLHPDSIIVLLPDWWERKNREEVGLIEELVKLHDERTKKIARKF